MVMHAVAPRGAAPLLLVLTLALLALVQFQSARAQTSWQPNMANGPLCAPGTGGINNTMFGYSVDLSSGVTENNNYTYLAVGRPWDSSVFIYRAATPTPTDPELFKAYNGSSFAFTPSNYLNTAWQLVQMLRDTGNSTYNPTMQSLFGYSVSLAQDASLLAVGIPSRNLGSAPSSMQANPQNGAVRVYARGGWSATINPTGSPTFNTGSQYLQWTGSTPGITASGNAQLPVDTLTFTMAPMYAVNTTYACAYANGTTVTDNSTLVGLNATDYSCNATSSLYAVPSVTVNATTISLTGYCANNWASTNTDFKLVNSSCSVMLNLTAPRNFTLRPNVTTITALCGTYSTSTSTCSGYIRLNNIGSNSVLGSVQITTIFTFTEAFAPLTTSALAAGRAFDMTYNTTTLWSEKFGAKVVFSRDANSTFLFVASNQGWEGLELNSGYTVTSTNLDRLGVNVFKRDPNNPRNFLRFTFLKAQSQSPLGTLGLDVAVFGNSTETLGVLVRDWYRVNYGNSPSGRVAVYMYNATAGAFSSSSVLVNTGLSSSSWRNEDWFGRGISTVTDTSRNLMLVAVGAPRDATQMYLFEANYTTLYGQQDTYNYTQNATGLVVQTPPVPTTMQPFGFGQVISNPNYRVRSSFFGGSTVFTPNGQFLIVADSSNSNGRGRVYVYRNYNSSLLLFNVSAALPTQYNYGLGRYFFYQVAELAKPVTAASAVSSSDGYKTDWFGQGLAANWWTIASSATVESCVHTYPVPQAYVDPSLYYVPPAVTNNTIVRNDTTSSNSTANVTVTCNGTLYTAPSASNASDLVTYCCPPLYNMYLIRNVTYCTNLTLNTNQTETNSSTTAAADTAAASSSATTATYSIVGGVVAAVCVIPATWLVLREVHKRQVQKRLERELVHAMNLSQMPSMSTTTGIGASDPHLMQTMYGSPDADTVGS